MICVGCGNDWWTEERVIRLAGMPSQQPHLRSLAREVRYRVKCAECGLQPGQEPTKKKGGRNRGR
jgi:hypothetical protein